MAQVEIVAPANVVKRNILLVKEIMRHLLNNPQVFSSLPDKFELVILPEDDPEMRLYNLELLDKGSTINNFTFLLAKSCNSN